MDNMFKMIETSDTNIKLEVANKFQNVEQELTKASTTVVSARLVKVRDNTKAGRVNVQDTTQNGFNMMRADLPAVDAFAKAVQNEAKVLINKMETDSTDAGSEQDWYKVHYT